MREVTSADDKQRPWTSIPGPLRVAACYVGWCDVVATLATTATPYHWPALTWWGLAHGTIFLVGPLLCLLLWLLSGARISQAVAATGFCILAVILFADGRIEASMWATVSGLLFWALAGLSYRVTPGSADES